MAEKATPVTPDEADDIRVTLDLDNGSVEARLSPFLMQITRIT